MAPLRTKSALLRFLGFCVPLGASAGLADVARYPCGGEGEPDCPTDDVPWLAIAIGSGIVAIFVIAW